jgi:hypothetical protein
MAYLYRHIRKDKDEVFYIGIGSDSDGGYNRAKSLKNRNRYWYNIVNKTKYEVEIILDDLTWEEACEKEIEFIKLYGRWDLKEGTLVNLTNGGDGSNGFIHSAETKIKMSEKGKGIPHSKEHNLKVAMALKGKSLPEETKRKISEAKKGKPSLKKGVPMSNEQKLKLSLAKTGKKHTKESIEKMSNSHKGIVHTDEAKNKIREKKKGVKQPIITCNYCGAKGGSSNMIRYHFDNCKFKDSDLVQEVVDQEEEDWSADFEGPFLGSEHS